MHTRTRRNDVSKANRFLCPYSIYSNPNSFGKNKDTAGKYVTSNSAMKITAKYGSIYLITLSIVTPPTRHPVKRIVPTGGVIVPIDRLKHRRIPKCIGLMPNAVQIGSKIGVNIRIAGVTSMNVPTTSNKILIRRRIKYLFVVSPRIAAATISGISVNAIAHDMIDERPIINVMIPVVFTDSRTILGMSVILNDL